ncbi:MAG TPA: AmmeMemoRadiSam system radical SAM enzyme [Candidatus Blautia merdigallinarum]|uniref:AmmeMemoRadiSam system radical SAM enzyme n=1 Tax=Candidatus Blautia merdigallinarum TaxID=2838495 RepID=A0A9D2N355_9FIRM|nr:AmmeMemoRadiSam system radical SAM enzyme [Candidatus Blautia merdigallinarum]
MKALCEVCMHKCLLAPGQYGICRARCNEGGKVVSKNYGLLTSLALDPIEKKPLKMFAPGSLILSAGSFGCNLRCPFCQNHEISMVRYEKEDLRYVSPKELTELAGQYQNRGNIGIAFTYNEPLVGYEYVRDTAKLVKKTGMKTVLVTNGSAALWVLEELLPYIDAMNIDLKGFRAEYYKKLGGDLKTVQDFIRHAAGHCHIELTTLIIPGENDSQEEMEEEAQWIAAINSSIPLHVTRFFPRYHMRQTKATPVETVYSLAGTAKKYLKHVFVGNC